MSYTYGYSQFLSANLDAFGRFRTSTTTTQFESKFTYGTEEKLFNTTATSGGAATFLSNEAAWRLDVTGTTGSRVIRESSHYMQYHPGKSQLVLMTGVVGTATDGCVKRLGYYDDNDGLFFIQNGTSGFGVCERSSVSGQVVDTIVYQSDWNIDRMDGTGPSGITLDTTKTQIFVMDFQWLGVGTVRYGLDIGGTLRYVHHIDHANLLTKVYMKSAWLPVRYEITNTTGTTANHMYQICSSVISEGGSDEQGNLFTAMSTTTDAAGSGAWTPLVSIRVSDQFNAQKFRGKIRLYSAEVLATSTNASAAVAIFENPTLTGSNFLSVNSKSAVLYDTTATALVNGTLRASAFIRASASNIVPGSDIPAYAGSTFTLAARGVGGSASVTSAFNWGEII